MVSLKTLSVLSSSKKERIHTTNFAKFNKNPNDLWSLNSCTILTETSQLIKSKIFSPFSVLWAYDILIIILKAQRGFPGGSDSKESAQITGDPGLIPGSGSSPEKQNGNPLQYACLDNPMDRGAWWATACGVGRSLTQLSFTRHKTQWVLNTK